MSYLISGQNSFLVEERVNALRNELDPQHLSTTRLDVQSSTIEQIASECQAMPFFGGRRVVILANPIGTSRRADVDEDAEDGGARIRWPELMGVLERVPPSTDIIMRHDGSLSLNHYVTKAVKKLGWAVESFQPLYGANLAAWVQERARYEGVEIDYKAAEELLQLLYPTSWRDFNRYATDTPDMQVIATEVAKLANGAIDGVVTLDVVRELVVDRAGTTAFLLNDQMFRGGTEAALVELANMIELGEAEERIIAGVAAESISVATVKLSNGVPPGAVASASGISEARLGALRPKASPLQPETLRSIAEAVREADAAVKTGMTTDASATVTPLVAGVAEAVRRSNRRGRR